MKNSDLTTIISGIIGVALIIMATVLLVYTPTNIIFAGSLVVIAAGLNGYNAALKAPSAQQSDQLINALAASGPVNPGPLVQIHNTPVETQVSSAALPGTPRAQAPQPIMLPLAASQQQPVPFSQGTMPVQDWQTQPQGTAPYLDRQWTNLGVSAVVPPGGQPPQQ